MTHPSDVFNRLFRFNPTIRQLIIACGLLVEIPTEDPDPIQRLIIALIPAEPDNINEVNRIIPDDATKPIKTFQLRKIKIMGIIRISDGGLTSKPPNHNPERIDFFLTAFRINSPAQTSNKTLTCPLKMLLNTGKEISIGMSNFKPFTIEPLSGSIRRIKKQGTQPE